MTSSPIEFNWWIVVGIFTAIFFGCCCLCSLCWYFCCRDECCLGYCDCFGLCAKSGDPLPEGEASGIALDLDEPSGDASKLGLGLGDELGKGKEGEGINAL